MAIGLFGTRARTAFALGVEDLDELARKVEALLALEPGKGGFPPSWASSPSSPSSGASSPGGSAGPRCRRWCGGGGGGPKAPSRPQVLASGRGPFLTLPLVITKDPETGELNLGMYRMQVLDPRSTAMHWQLHKVGRRHLEKAKRLGRKLEVAVALGGTRSSPTPPPRPSLPCRG